MGQLAKAVYGEDPAAAASCRERRCHGMKQTSPASVLAEARTRLQTHGGSSEAGREAVEAEINSLESHASRTHHGEYPAKGGFMGSGLVEAGCKTKTRVGGHLKQSGRFWSETGVETIHGLRCLILGPHTDEARKQPGNLVTRQKAKVRGRSGEPEKRAAWIFRPAPCSDDDSPRKDETGLPQSEGPPAVSGDAPPEPAPSSGRMRSTRRLMPSSANSLCG